MDETVRRHLAATRRLTAEALSADGVHAVDLCQRAKEELARAQNLLVRAVTERALRALG